MPLRSAPPGWRDIYHQYCGPQVVASVHGITPEVAADWLVRLGAVASNGRGTHTFGLACALGSRELHLARWHDRPAHDFRAWPTGAQFLREHSRSWDEFVLISRDHVAHVRAGEVVCDTAGSAPMMRVLCVVPIRQAWPRCPCAQQESLAVWLEPYTRWRRGAAAA